MSDLATVITKSRRLSSTRACLIVFRMSQIEMAVFSITSGADSFPVSCLTGSQSEERNSNRAIDVAISEKSSRRDAAREVVLILSMLEFRPLPILVCV